jgi:hypothetical protein
MIIQKTSTLKFLRYLGIFCAITMGFFSIVATSEDDAADAIGVPESADTSFNLQSVEVVKGTGGLATEEECGSTTIQDELDNSDLSQDLLDLIDTIQFTQLDIDYVLSFDGAEEPLTCTLTIEYNAADVEIATITVDQANASLKAVTVPDTAMEAINYHLANWDAPLVYCVTCTDNDLSANYTLTYTPTFQVKVSR